MCLFLGVCPQGLWPSTAPGQGHRPGDPGQGQALALLSPCVGQCPGVPGALSLPWVPPGSRVEFALITVLSSRTGLALRTSIRGAESGLEHPKESEPGAEGVLGLTGRWGDPSQAAQGVLAPSICGMGSCCLQISSFHEPIKEGFYHLFQLIFCGL